MSSTFENMCRTPSGLSALATSSDCRSSSTSASVPKWLAFSVRKKTGCWLVVLSEVLYQPLYYPIIVDIVFLLLLLLLFLFFASSTAFVLVSLS